jgi:hypothetical protein
MAAFSTPRSIFPYFWVNHPHRVLKQFIETKVPPGTPDAVMARTGTGKKKKFNHSRMSSSVTHPLLWTLTTIPDRNLYFGRVYILKITNGGKLWPSVVIANITVHCCLSPPVTLNLNWHLTTCSIAVNFTLLKHNGIWSPFPIWDRK